MVIGKSPADSLMRIAGAQCVSRALHVVAALGVADALDDVPLTARALAAATGTHVDTLERVLRLLAQYEIFALRNGQFIHTSASRLLRSDHPHSLRSFVRMMGFPIYWRMWEAFDESVRTGTPAGRRLMPEGGWQYLAEHPEEGRIFAEAMAAKAHVQIPAILRAYDFSRFDRIGDIGGGQGHLLRAVLGAAPQATGILFDLPHVIELAAQTAAERLAFQAGSFFGDRLPPCDCYLVMHVLHDWSDKDAVRILRAISDAAPPKVAVLVIESVVPDVPMPTWERILDLHMLAIHGGRERTQQEYAGLLALAGFSLHRAIDTSAGVWVLEAQRT